MMLQNYVKELKINNGQDGFRIFETYWSKNEGWYNSIKKNIKIHLYSVLQNPDFINEDEDFYGEKKILMK